VLKPLDIIAVMDNRPGHWKQTEAIVRALAAFTAVNIRYRRVACDLRSDLRQWGSAVTAMLKPSKKAAENPDIVIGTGSHTHATIIELGLGNDAKKIICMSPPTGLGVFFDLCFIPEHDRVPPRKNFFFTVGPPNLSKPSGRQDNRKGLILVGGTDPTSHHWRSSEIAATIQGIIDHTPAVHWTLSTSPRTPPEMEQAFLTGFQGHRVNVVLFSQTPPQWIEQHYSTCKWVWVTADSMSMVYEALSAGCRVGLIPVAWKRSTSKFVRAEQHLIGRGHATSYPKWISAKTFPKQRRAINEAERCATEILRRWWPERLP
jgi:uncharacterized protein